MSSVQMGDKKELLYACSGDALSHLVHPMGLLDLTERTYIGIFPALCNEQKYLHKGDFS